MALTKVTKSGVDDTLVTGQTLLDEKANDADTLLVYDADAGGLKRVTKQNVAPTLPTVTFASKIDGQGYIATGESDTFIVRGTNFVSVPRVSIFQTSTGIYTDASVVSFTSATELSVTVTAPSSGDYFVKVENPDGSAGTSATALLQASPGPIWQTAAGSLGSVLEGASISLSTVAYTSDSAAVTFTETTAVLTSNTDTPATTMNLTLNANDGTITGTAPTVDADTTYTFTLRATDPQSQFADRQFSITVTNSNWFGDESDGALDTTP